MSARTRKPVKAGKSAAPKRGNATAGAAVIVCLALVALVWQVFGQTVGHAFVNYDDPSYVYENPIVTKGLTLEGLGWAFTQPHARNWHPLTTISHMLDCQLFGRNAGAHHAVNVLLHSATAALLFLVIWRMTAAFWRSAFVAAVFAIHPLRVESVAWISERKDVLSGLFFVLTIGAYHRYTQRQSRGRYLLLLTMAALGLMSKPMLVTLPVVLLLLDYWPLRRFPGSADSDWGQWRQALRRLIMEKLPLFALAAAAGLATLLIQKTGGAMRESLPLGWRIANAFVSCAAYLRDLFWPAALAPFYPHPEGAISGAAVTAAVVLVLGISAAAFVWRTTFRYLAAGWLWYLVMLAPVIGIVDVGAQARADRYTYLPQIGILVALTWAACHVAISRNYRRVVLGAGGALIVVALAWRAHAQTTHWRSSDTLWAHTLAVTADNHVAHNNVGELHWKRGETDQALAEYQRALEIRLRSRRGRYDFLLALYHSNVGSALQRKGAVAEAVSHYQQAIEIQPDYAEAYLNLGSGLAEQGKLDDALATFQKLAAAQPDHAEAHTSIATLLIQKGSERDAVKHYEKALEVAPRHTTALNNLGYILATSRDVGIRNAAKAVVLIERAIEAQGGASGFLLHKLAAAQAANGEFRKAEQTAARALQLANQQGNAALAGELQRNIGLYRADMPLTEVGGRQ